MVSSVSPHNRWSHFTLSVNEMRARRYHLPSRPRSASRAFDLPERRWNDLLSEFFTVNQCRTILSLCPHFLSRSKKPLSQEFKAGAQMRWAQLARNYISAWLSRVQARNTSEREENIFMSWRWPCSAERVLLQHLKSCSINLHSCQLDCAQVEQK